MPRRLLLPLFALLAFVVAPAVAGACEPTTSEPRFCGFWGPVGHPCASGDVAGKYYIAEDCPYITLGNAKCVASLWIYEETNGIAGLQRRDEVKDDTCRGAIAGDTIVL